MCCCPATSRGDTIFFSSLWPWTPLNTIEDIIIPQQWIQYIYIYIYLYGIRIHVRIRICIRIRIYIHECIWTHRALQNSWGVVFPRSQHPNRAFPRQGQVQSALPLMVDLLVPGEIHRTLGKHPGNDLWMECWVHMWWVIVNAIVL
jgi:hypothetical protein